MSIEVNGKTIETTENGYLVNHEDWNEDIGKVLAEGEGIEMTQEHWDVVEYLREEHFNNAGNEPNERTILKDMGKKWGKKVSSKDMYLMFPQMPSKQGRKIAGLPQSTRKGGY
ncbi:MAG: TusE/DsrC/DsvC family sulfur relay protein [Gammaproteobacteria bacterium]|nr:TusE/DsrC/DsvC family sulfur relay protein [Gammaproteobacteria bacterium]MDH5778307.1 TusE/DsrC/DsvC family sulfur relay protein [Gammaproteobacteria bacterium]